MNCTRGNHCQCLYTFGTWTSTGTSKWLSWEVGTRNSEWSQDPKACQVKTIRSQIELELASIRARSTTIDEVVMFLSINCLIIPTKSFSDMFFILSDQEATLSLVSPTCTTLTDGSFWIFFVDLKNNCKAMSPSLSRRTPLYPCLGNPGAWSWRGSWTSPAPSPF